MKMSVEGSYHVTQAEALLRALLPREAANFVGKTVSGTYSPSVQKAAEKFNSFAAAEAADRDFYQKLSGNERLRILLELINHAPEQRLERIYRVTKLARR